MPNKLEHVFQECVGLIRKGTPIAVCLERYPNYAIELQPMLEATFATSDQLGTSMPAMSRSHIRSSILDAWDKQHAPRRWPWQLATHLPRLAMASAMVLVIVALSGTGVVMAAQDAAPGTAFYSIKQAYEDTRLRLSLSPEQKVEVYTDLVRERASELREISSADASGQAHSTVERLEKHFRDADTLRQQVSVDQSSVNDEINTTMLKALETAITEARSVETTIETTIQNAPKNAYPCIEHSLESIRFGYEKVRAAVEAVDHLLPNGSTASVSTVGLCSP